VVNK